MTKDFFADLCRSKPELLATIIAYNGLLPVACGKDASVPGMSAESVVNLAREPRLRRALAAEQVAGPLFWDFSETSRRLALVDAPTLETLALHFGAACHARSIAALVARDEVLALKAELGDALYAYALTRGRFALGNLAALFTERDSRLPFAQRVRRHGWAALAAVRAAWPEALRCRSAAAFAPGDALAEHAAPAGERASLWFGLRKILLKEVAPQWTPCFA